MTADAGTLLITAPFAAQWLERLRTRWPDLRIELLSPRSMRTVPEILWREVEILYTSFATELPLPAQAPRLRWVQLYSAGPDQILDDPLFHTAVVFTTASGVHAINMAEYVLGIVLAWFQRLPCLLEWQRRRRWPAPQERDSMATRAELRERTIGIVGYGSIGREVARLATAFGMRVLAMQRGTDHRDRGFQFPGIGDAEGTLPERFYTADQLHDLLRECDVVVIAVPLTAQTRRMFDEAAFSAMKPTAFLVNIARGDVCDEDALVAALETQQIAGAALDVFHQEPLPANHPLWHLSNAFISPHSAGLTSQYGERAAAIFEENLHRYFAGDDLYNVVDKTQGY
jgi:phosphoglycerate dehydrogenase-like enzyme